jgi:hypothetical protein
MYLNFEILQHGYRSIYLGESIPLDNLKELKNYFDNITFVTYMTVEPNKDEINSYINSLTDEILNDSETELWLIGRMVNYINEKNITPKTKIFKSISDLIIKL